MSALAWAFLVALVVLVITSRLEHRLARHAAYRVSRHVLRLGLLGLAAYVLWLRSTGTVLIRPNRVQDLALLWSGLRDPAAIGVVAGVVLPAHFLLWTEQPAAPCLARRA